MNLRHTEERGEPATPIPAFPLRGQEWTVRCAQKSCMT